MNPGVLPRTQLASMLDTFRVSVLLAGSHGKVHLFTNDFTPDPNTLFAAFIAPVGSWYTPQLLPWGAVFGNPDGSVSTEAVSAQFDYSGTDPSETVYGWYVTDNAGAVLLLSGRLDTPVVMGQVLDAVVLLPGLTVPSIDG